MDTKASLRVHSVIAHTRVAGPGRRLLIHTQGCTLGCPGCFNPATHDPAGGETLAVADLLARIADTNDIEGITVSGGEPMQQAAALARLLEGVRSAGLSIILYSGYTLEEIRALPGGEHVLKAVDVLIDGRYQAGDPCRDGYRGSSNQRLHFLTRRYTPADFPPQPAALEAEIAPDGSVALRGFPDEELRRTLAGLLSGTPKAVGEPKKKD